MRAVIVTEPGGPEVLTWAEVPDPVCGPGEVIVDVVATAVNRADLMQRQGFYPPPPGASEILGLECSGVVSEVGADVTDWSVGDEVCALLAGGGYAERVAVPAGQLLPRPAGGELATAAALPEVVCTVWSNVFLLAGLRRGDSFLVHGGSSGIGTMAIQLAARAGARVFTTAGTADKLAVCRELGADVGINYRDEDFVARVSEESGGDGVRRARQHGREVPRPQRRRARDRRPPGLDRHAGRDEGGAGSREAHAQARLGPRHHVAGPPGDRPGRQGGDRRRGPARRVARRRAGRHPADRRPTAADVPGRRGARGRGGQRAHRQGPADP